MNSNLKQILEERKIPGWKLSQLSKIPPSKISKMKNGTLAIGPKQLNQLAKALNVEETDICPRGAYSTYFPKNNLKTIRGDKSQLSLAYDTGLHPAVISQIELRKIPGNKEARKKIAKALSVKVSDIWPEDKEEE
ncbi:Cro/C1-type HTH DNA-binding domain-containing protein [Dethiosulfatibacter aminovorans DSM 17477]|uniref:Cro/C1-type HTH DNA-binding domain-containing protein n=1 Tax=Dethiosulfatibacter aminovorans DSM 17477 TaxID=1121476 RepID=A0A1M6LG69_9FIRM|nr:helix-turn-helix transcriptional regulator [Dethiosulfatibacter aminovorans]SHJ70204.1 Cro/C1-type HTH DNA-binding domain-containing protein [Dethiosulfatibacter aminovorans DSM 17477]